MTEYLFNQKHLAKEFCYYIEKEPECMDNCYVEEPKGKKPVMVPECPYVVKHRRVFDEGTRDGWEFDRCELRDWAGDPLARWLWTWENCPCLGEILNAFLEDYSKWARRQE